jgi:hypothetical protein
MHRRIEHCMYRHRTQCTALGGEQRVGANAFAWCWVDDLVSFQENLPRIFDSLALAYRNIVGRIAAENMKVCCWGCANNMSAPDRAQMLSVLCGASIDLFEQPCRRR